MVEAIRLAALQEIYMDFGYEEKVRLACQLLNSDCDPSDPEVKLLRLYVQNDYECLDSDEKIQLVCRLIESDYNSTEAENYVLANAEAFFGRIMQCGNNKVLRILLNSGRIMGELPDDLFDRLTAYAECDGTLRVLFGRVMRIPESPEPFLIEDNVLVRCNNRDIEEADIPDEVTTILGSAFERCKKLKKVWLPEGLRHIGHRAFYGCSVLETVLPGSLWLIDNQKQLIMPEYVFSIGHRAFGNCMQLSSVELSDSVDFVGNYAFTGCLRIKEFSLHEKVGMGNNIIDIWRAMEHVTVRRDSGTYVIDLEENERCVWHGWPFDLLRLMLRRKYTGFPPGLFHKFKYLITSMLICNDDNGETVDYVLSGYRQENLSLLLNRLEPELMERLLGCGKLTVPPLSRLYNELLDYTIETQSHDLQLRLMRAAEMEDNHPEKRFQL